MSYKLGGDTWDKTTTEDGLLPVCWAHPRGDGYASLVHHQGENDRTLCGIKYRDWYFEAYDAEEIEIDKHCVSCYRCTAILKKREKRRKSGKGE